MIIHLSINALMPHGLTSVNRFCRLFFLGAETRPRFSLHLERSFILTINVPHRHYLQEPWQVYPRLYPGRLITSVMSTLPCSLLYAEITPILNGKQGVFMSPMERDGNLKKDSPPPYRRLATWHVTWPLNKVRVWGFSFLLKNNLGGWEWQGG